MPRANYFQHIRDAVERFKRQSGCWEAFLGPLKTYIDETYKTRPPIYCYTKQLILKEISPHLKNRAFDKLVRDTFHETREEKKQTVCRQQRAVEKRNEEVTQFRYEYVEGVVQMCSESLDPVDWFIALQVSCGARQRDIFDKDICNFDKSTNESEIIQNGCTKARGKKVVANKPLFVLKSTVFLKLLYQLRELLEGGGAQESRNWNERLCVRTRFYFPVKSPRSGTHANRAIYASAISYEAKKRNISDARFIQLALNHGTMTSALHYLYVSVGDHGFDGHLVRMHTDTGWIGIPKIPPRLFKGEVERRYECASLTLTEAGINLTRDLMQSLGFPISLLSRKRQREEPEPDFLVD